AAAADDPPAARRGPPAPRALNWREKLWRQQFPGHNRRGVWNLLSNRCPRQQTTSSATGYERQKPNQESEPDMAIDMKVDGVKGRVTATGYEDHIEVESCQVGATCPTQARAGNMGDRTGGTISYSDISVSRTQDDSTTELFQKMFEKKQLSKVEFKFVKTGEKFHEY